MKKPILIGEQNPFGGAIEFDLWPEPDYCSGGRLMKHLNMSQEEYLDLFDRVNLCRGKWAMKEARIKAWEIATDAFMIGGRELILLGAKVCSAFRMEYKPFAVKTAFKIKRTILPHPSGRNLIWNEPMTRVTAQQVVAHAIHRSGGKW